MMQHVQVAARINLLDEVLVDQQTFVPSYV